MPQTPLVVEVRVGDLPEVKALIAEAAAKYEAMAALAGRLWSGDAPDDVTLESIEAWKAGLPDAEREALDAVLA